MSYQLDWNDSRFINLPVIANLIHQPIHIITPDGIIQFVNDAWCAVYQVSREEAIGRHIEEAVTISRTFLRVTDDLLCTPSDQGYERLEKPTSRSTALIALEQGKRVSMLTQLPSDYSKVIITSTPIFDDNHQPICVFTLIQDLTLLAHWRDYFEEELQQDPQIWEELQYLQRNYVESDIVGNSKETSDLRNLISIVAASDASVLITGESGTGKELVAKEIHKRSERSSQPFIAVNCAAIPESLLESEFFGYEKGAFTGASTNKMGYFEMANHGTILLDEIGEFPLHLQSKLLRVLQEKTVSRLGSTSKISLDVRVIAATNRDLLAMTKTGDFRLDLYYRLNVFSVRISPLRDRVDDIPLLAATFLKQFNTKYKKSKSFTSQALFALSHYPWPGNVRELENTIERVVVIGDQPVITLEHIRAVTGAAADKDAPDAPPTSLKEAVNDLERKLISQALETYKSTYRAAEALGSTQSTIARKAKALGIIWEKTVRNQSDNDAKMG